MNEVEQDDPTGCVHEDAVKWNPYNKVVQCHRCGRRFEPIGSEDTVAPADAVWGFAAWLTTRSEHAGPFSGSDDSAPMAQLVARFCRFQGWEVGPNYPETFRMPPDSERG